MLHSCFVSFVLCFVYTLRYFYTLYGTNLLTRCHSASCLFSVVFHFRKTKKMNILGIGRDKSQYAYFSRRNKETRSRDGGAHCWRYAQEAIIKWLLSYLHAYDKCLHTMLKLY